MHVSEGWKKEHANMSESNTMNCQKIADIKLTEAYSNTGVTQLNVDKTP